MGKGKGNRKIETPWKGTQLYITFITSSVPPSNIQWIILCHICNDYVCVFG